MLNNSIIIGFVALIVILTYADLHSFYVNEGRWHRTFRHDVLTLGILGTFIGILIGLWGFDVTDITASIPKLLEGMKLAFITSIAGMTCSVMITITQKYRPSHYAKSGNPVTDKLAEQSRLLVEFLEDSKKTNDAVVEQVQHHRVESKDELGKVRQSLDDTLKKLSEGITKEIIQTLENVIADFNHNLTEQFGENFKQLNAACLQLVQWQKDYMATIRASEQALSETKGALASTAQSVSDIAKRNEEFEQFCNNTALSLVTMNNMLKNNTKLQAAMQTAIDSLINTSRELEKIPEAFKKIAKEMNENNNRAVGFLEGTNTKLDRCIEETQEAVKKLNAGMVTATNNLNDSLVSLTNQFGRNYEVFLEQINKLMPES